MGKIYCVDFTQSILIIHSEIFIQQVMTCGSGNGQQHNFDEWWSWYDEVLLKAILQIDHLVQDYNNSYVSAMELLQSCTKLLEWFMRLQKILLHYFCC